MRMLNGTTRRLATDTAMTDCELLRLDNASINRVLHEQRVLSSSCLSVGAQYRDEADLVDQLFNSVKRLHGARFSDG